MTVFEGRRLRIPGVLDRVPVACAFVVDAARQAGLEENAIYHCQLAIDEACSNVVEHGYGGDGANRAIDIVCRAEDNRFSITVIDDSLPFDPLSATDPDPAMPIEQREPGGWGIYFIKKVMDEVTYQYEDNQNTLLMVKHIEHPMLPRDPRHQPSMVSITSPEPDVRLIAPHGRFDSRLSPSLEGTFLRQLEAGHRWLILDLSDVDYVSSSGLKTLIVLWKRAHEANADFVVAGLRPRVRDVFQMIGLDMVFTIFESAEEAAARFTTPGMP